MPEESQAKTKTARDPQALTSEYHKARKQLMLWAGILFIWELVGIDLEKAKEAGGNAGAIITAIKSPQAVPWVLLILVAYFSFKVSVEWYQCNLQRRQLRVARLDVMSAWIIALAAYALYFWQRLSRVQVADRFQVLTSNGRAFMIVLSACSAFGLVLSIFHVKHNWGFKSEIGRRTLIWVGALYTVVFLPILFMSRSQPKMLVIGAGIGSALGLLLRRFARYSVSNA